MRRLTTNELRLAVLFGAAIFIALNLLAARVWMQKRGDILRDIQTSRASIQESQTWIEGAAAIGSARDWISANPPPTDTAEQASTSLLKVVRSAAEAAGLKVIEENLLPAPDVQAGTAAALQAKVSGPVPGVTRFLFALQNPTAWRAIPRMIIQSEAEPPNVLVDMEIRQYYRAETSDAPAPGP